MDPCRVNICRTLVSREFQQIQQEGEGTPQSINVSAAEISDLASNSVPTAGTGNTVPWSSESGDTIQWFPEVDDTIPWFPEVDDTIPWFPEADDTTPWFPEANDTFGEKLLM